MELVGEKGATMIQEPGKSTSCMIYEDSCSSLVIANVFLRLLSSYLRPSLTPHLFNPRTSIYGFSEPFCNGVAQVFSPSKYHIFYF